MIVAPSDTLVLGERLGECGAPSHLSGVGTSLDDVQRTHIVSVLRECGGRVKGKHGAAARLELKPSTLRDRMKRLGIEPQAFRPKPGLYVVGDEGLSSSG